MAVSSTQSGFFKQLRHTGAEVGECRAYNRSARDKYNIHATAKARDPWRNCLTHTAFDTIAYDSSADFLADGKAYPASLYATLDIHQCAE